MSQSLPKIYFWLPTEIGPQPFPDNADTFIPRRGFDSWITQTYLRLTEAGFSCQLTGTLPEEGIIVAYRDFLPYSLQPGPKQFIVCVKADKNPNPYAQIHVSHNPIEAELPDLTVQSIPDDYQLLLGPRYYIPHWPQPGLIPRESERETRLENIAYYGTSYNLAAELKQEQWQRFVASLGLNWVVEQRRDQWHNYSHVDVVVAVRSFSGETDYSWKPASKLFNSWRAGVPAILGAESAFKGERKNQLDYIEADSYEAAKSALQRLQNSPELYQAMQNNGFQRAREIEIPQIVAKWQHFLLEVAVPGYENWCAKSSRERRLYYLRRSLAIKASRLKKITLKQLFL